MIALVYIKTKWCEKMNNYCYFYCSFFKNILKADQADWAVLTKLLSSVYQTIQFFSFLSWQYNFYRIVVDLDSNVSYKLVVFHLVFFGIKQQDRVVLYCIVLYSRFQLKGQHKPWYGSPSPTACSPAGG